MKPTTATAKTTIPAMMVSWVCRARSWRRFLSSSRLLIISLRAIPGQDDGQALQRHALALLFAQRQRRLIIAVFHDKCQLQPAVVFHGLNARSVLAQRKPDEFRRVPVAVRLAQGTMGAINGDFHVSLPGRRWPNDT